MWMTHYAIRCTIRKWAVSASAWQHCLLPSAQVSSEDVALLSLLLYPKAIDLRCLSALHAMLLHLTRNCPPTLRKPTPSFVSIANRRGVTAESVGNFLRTTHSTTTPPFKMPNPKMADYQIDAIVSYLLSLKRQH